MDKLKKKEYENLLEPMQVELNNLARWLKHTGTRMLVLIEGRDTARQRRVDQRHYRTAQPPPGPRRRSVQAHQRERTQWYFQRYISHLPAAGELVVFDRSWYNRAGVEKVMGVCTSGEYELFLKQAPVFEKMLVDEGIVLHKYWSPVDQSCRKSDSRSGAGSAETLETVSHRSRGGARYPSSGEARDRNEFEATNEAAPWFAVICNNQRRGRLNLIRHLLGHTRM